MTDIAFTDIDRQFSALVMRLAGERASPALGHAAALASRATGSGDVCVQLAPHAKQPIDTNLSGNVIGAAPHTTPSAKKWRDLLLESGVVGEPGAFAPLVLDRAGRLYLYRYWDYEKRLADELLARAVDADGVNDALLKQGLKRFFPDVGDVDQKLAAATAVLRKLCIISGGPGTGKTTTVVKILALLAEQAPERKLAIGLAAPTGKAAARVQDAVSAALERLDVDLFARASMPTEAKTLHRLLGVRPDAVTFRHNREHPLPLDVLVVDEASMADLALATKLIEALPPAARLILLGDKDQLASVEAGSVLGDICRDDSRSVGFAKRLAGVAGVKASEIGKSRSTSPLADSVALLKRSYRFGGGSGIGNLARAVNDGDASRALALLQNGEHDDIAWRTVTPGDLRALIRTVVDERLRAHFSSLTAEPQDVFERFNQFRVLCAHRNGLFGVTGLNRLIEDALEGAGLIQARHAWYAGRPVMIARNDYSLRLFNGDVGIALPTGPGELKVFFSGPEGVRSFTPSRLPEHETVYAMTIHKSQGSEFGDVLMVLPNELSPVLSRELVYTGITRARSRVEIWGNEAAFTGAVERRLVRASALAERLWG